MKTDPSQQSTPQRGRARLASAGHYVLIAVCFMLAGAVMGGAWGLLTRHYAPEYLLVIKHVANDTIWLEPGKVAGRMAGEGMKFGLFAGTLLLALRALRWGRLPRGKEAWKMWLVGLLSAGLGAALAGLFTWYYVRHGGRILSSETLAQIGSIYRVQLLVAAEWGAIVGVLMATVVMGLWGNRKQQ